MPYTYNFKLNFIKDWVSQLKRELEESGYKVDGCSDDDVCIKYLNLNKRLVHPKPRKVLISKQFKYNPKFKVVINNIIQKIESGENITSYLSKNITNLDYNDPLLNDWDIHHLHLGSKPDSENPKFIDRTGPLLFVRFTEDIAYFINVYKHGDWTKQEMVRIIHENWAESIKLFKMNDVISLEYNVTDDDYANFRKNNISTFVEIEKGVVYFPLGRGYSLSGHSTQVIMDKIHYFRTLENYEKWIKEHIGEIVKKYKSFGLNQNNKMYFYPVIVEDYISTYELYSGINIKLGKIL